MSTRLLVLLVFTALVASISLLPGLTAPARAADDVCYEGTGDLCASTCGEDFPDVQITEVCATYNGQTSCECCCYYNIEN